MANKKPYNLIAFDGLKAVTIWGDEGWQILSGNDRERPETEIYYTARVPIVYRGMEIRADAVSSIPFDLVNDKTGDVIDSSDDWQNECGFLPHPEELFWMLEASWVVSGMAYLLCSTNPGGYVKILKPLSPASIRYDVEKDVFTRMVKMNTQSIDKIYPEHIDASGKVTSGESIIPLWKPDPDVEKGPPLKWPGKAALQAMGVLYNLDDAATGFFKRGLLHTYIFRVPPGTQQADKDMLEDRVKNLLSGIKNAWRTLFLNADKVEPVDIGGGLESLANVPLTKEKREDVSIALGIPMSILFSETARGLGGKGVVDADDKRLIEVTALPDWLKLARILNEQLFLPMGMRLVDNHETMRVFQENEQDRAVAIMNYVNAFNTNMEVANIMADALGFTLTDEQQAAIDALIQKKQEAADKVAQQTQQQPPEAQGQPTGESNPVPNEPQSQANTPDVGMQEQSKSALSLELEKFKRKALKHVGEPVEFESEIIPAEMMAAIQESLKACTSADEVKAVFAEIKTDKEIIPMPKDGLFALAAAINNATKAIQEPEKNQDHSTSIILDTTGQAVKMDAANTQAIIDAILKMGQSINDRPVIVNLPDQPTPQVTVNMPEQAPAQITVNVPEQPAPVVNLPAPQITLKMPERAKSSLNVKRDKDGKLVGIEER